jgi:hypothetical protein
MANENDNGGEGDIHLIDGDARHRENPGTFGMPDIDARRAVDVGSVVKIGLEGKEGGERFWVKIVSAKEGYQFEGEVMNRLICFDVDGVIPFGLEHILSIHEG